MPTAKFHHSIANLIEALENCDHSGEEDVVYLPDYLNLMYEGDELKDVQLVRYAPGVWVDEDVR